GQETERSEPRLAELTLDADLRRLGAEGLHVLKVDVDGGDLGVLLGARELLAEHRPLLIVELSERPGEILDLLDGVGYERFYDMDLRPWARGEPWPENLIASTHALG
ncbi:MAG: FkbM family methyltransferase, partial [Holophagales bacterium]|nr:FkbM family methyltransferase [Holophagales bacterium]